jgi:hypothetical protein
MANCTSPVKIHQLVENELKVGQAEELTGHLESCESCSRQFHRLSRMKGLIEASLASEAGYFDSSAAIINRAFEDESPRVHRGRFRIFLKRALIGAAASAAAVVIGVFLFAHFYFQRTFSYELSNEVVRCSNGIEISDDGSEWRPLRVGDRLKEGTRIQTLEGAESFMSFDGIRVLADGAAVIESRGERVISLDEGGLVVASAERKKHLNIELGEALIRSNSGVFRISRSDSSASIEVASGHVDLITPDGTNHRLASNQAASFSATDAAIKLASREVGNPFARLKSSAIDRIKQRFAQVMSKYQPNFQTAWNDIERSNGARMLGMWNQPEEMFQFAAYYPEASSSYTRTNNVSMDKYYEELFAPSNRSISIGRERVVPLEDDNSPAYPVWSHDGSMVAYVEFNYKSWPAAVKVARLDDLENPWVISQEDEAILPFFPVAWAPDGRHVLFMVANGIEETETEAGWNWGGPYKMKIAPIDPLEGPVRDFNSPFYDIEFPIELQAPVGKTISPHTLNLPWGDNLLCVNWGNIAYIPLEPDGQAVAGAPGLFITDFSQYEFFVAAAMWSPSGDMITFLAVEQPNVKNINVYILYEVEDILDGFSPPPRSLDDPRIRKISPSENDQLPGGFSFDESLVFFHEDISGVWRALYPMSYGHCDFDLFYASALPGENGPPTQIALPGSQVALKPSPEGNRIAYCQYDFKCECVDGKRKHTANYDLRIVSFDIEADIEVDLGGVLIDNSGTSLIVPPGALEENFTARISTPFSIGEEAELSEGEDTFFAMRLIEARGLDDPKFIEPMTLTIRYTDDEVAGLDEDMLEIYYYDETDPENPEWIALGGTVDPEYNEITVEIRHFSKFSVGGRMTAHEKRK